MAMPYDLALSDSSRHQLYGPWRVAAADELVLARGAGGVEIDPAVVVAVADRRGAVVAIEV